MNKRIKFEFGVYLLFMLMLLPFAFINDNVSNFVYGCVIILLYYLFTIKVELMGLNDK